MISMITCYDYSFAKALDGLVNLFLVGDSVGMVVYGEKDTKAVTLDTMVHHTQAVCRGAKKTNVVSDLPIHSYDTPAQALKSARKLQEAGAFAVKLEGATQDTLAAVAAISNEMNVMGHVGLTPQWLEENKVQGKSQQSAQRILEEAFALQNAGCFAIVLECMPENLAQKITQTLRIPTIGIGAGRYCGGQVLVLYDMLGLYGDFSPKFVKQYADLSEAAREAVRKFTKEIGDGTFPEEKHVFK